MGNLLISKTPRQTFKSHTTTTVTMFRSTIIRNARLFSTNARFQKSAAETVKDAAQAVDRTISDAAVKGIEKGEQAAASIKSATNISTGEAKGSASQMAGQAQGKASELAGQVKGAVNEMSRQRARPRRSRERCKAVVTRH